MPPRGHSRAFRVRWDRPFLRGRRSSDRGCARRIGRSGRRILPRVRLGPVRAYRGRAHSPASDVELRVNLELIGFVAVVLFEREHLIFMLVFSAALFAFVEAGFRGRLVNLDSSVNIVGPGACVPG